MKNAENLIAKEIKSFDLIMSQTNIADGIVATHLSKKYHIPHIHVLRGTINQEIFDSKPIQEIIDNAATLITPSPTMYKFIQQKGLDITLMPHGVDKAFFFDGQKDFTKAKFITIANLLVRKNVHLVLKSLKAAKEKGYDFEYTIVGDGPEKQHLEQLVLDLKLTEEVKFTGWLEQKEIIEQLQYANVFIMISNPETLGRVYLEAAAAGCLCIGHKGIGIDGLFTHKVNAIFCDKDSLNIDIIEVLKNLNSSIIREYISASKQLINNLHWNSVSEDYIKHFKMVLSQPH